MAKIKILLVDDNRERETFFEPLADLVSNILHYELVQAHTFEEMKGIFEESQYEYQAIILDGKGQKNNSSKTEDDSFLNTSLKWLHDKSKEGCHIPFVIYSGFAEELKKYYNDEPIFWKGKSEEEEMLKYLKTNIEKSEYFKHLNICPEIFSLFSDKLLDSKYQPELISAAQVYNDTFSGNLQEVLRSLRPILESTFSKLRELDQNLISYQYFKRGDPNISGIIKYLAGSILYNKSTDELEFHSDPVMPLHVYYLTEALKNITSKAGMHHYDKASSKYLVKAAVNSLFEYLSWYQKFAKINYLNRIVIT